MNYFFVIVTVFFILNAEGQSNPSSVTSARAPCFDCLVNQNPLSSIREVTDLCMKALPEYCKDVNPQYTPCSPNDHSWSQDSINVAKSCAMGIGDGATDLFTGMVGMVKGAGQFVVDEKYRTEALNTMSYMAESMTNASATDVKNFFMTPILGYIDEVSTCLNGYGRFHYFCEGGTQIFLPLGIANKTNKMRKQFKQDAAARRAKLEQDAAALRANPYVKVIDQKVIDQLPESARKNFYNQLSKVKNNKEIMDANSLTIANNQTDIIRRTTQASKFKHRNKIDQIVRNEDIIADSKIKIDNLDKQIKEKISKKHKLDHQFPLSKGFDPLGSEKSKILAQEVETLTRQRHITNRTIERLTLKNKNIIKDIDDPNALVNVQFVRDTQKLTQANKELILKNSQLSRTHNEMYDELHSIVKDSNVPSKYGNQISEKLKTLYNTDNAFMQEAIAVVQ